MFPVLRRLSGLCEGELDAALVSPFLERLRRELRAVIYVIDTGVPAHTMTRSSASATSAPLKEKRGSINGDSRLN